MPKKTPIEKLNAVFKAIKTNDAPVIALAIKEEPELFFLNIKNDGPPYALVHEIGVYSSPATFKAIAPAIHNADVAFEEQFFTAGSVVNKCTVAHIAAAGGRGELFLEMIGFSPYARAATNAQGATPVMLAAQYCDETTMQGVAKIDKNLFAVLDGAGKNAANYAIAGKKSENLEVIHASGVTEMPPPPRGGDPNAARRPRAQLSRFEA